MKFVVSLPLNAAELTQAAPEFQTGGGLQRRTPKVRSKLVWGHAPKEFFFDNAKFCHLGHSFIFLSPWGGAWLPWPPLPLERPMAKGCSNTVSKGRG